MVEYVRIAFLVVGSIPLLVYPFVAIASLMGLGSQSTIDIPLFNRIMNLFFLWGTLTYPVVLLLCFWLSGKVQAHGVYVACFPLLFLFLLWVSFHFMDAP
ncbi:hypothetical protein EZV61_16860 [Corallincola luteus]|uniref:Uncharacterized protein n=2 Tax=Corallincola TaxID=1775176 RepID=A0ABY1WMA9_9GAMM|nr:hypothetical protein EXY25_15590 [Corallincola spongiicola]TCI01642.1 hypothetical protein EZV61_16860 [Corallincola luteus]